MRVNNPFPRDGVPLLLFAGIVILAGTGTAARAVAQGPIAEPTRVTRATFPITLEGREYDLNTDVIDFAPGAGAPPHFHGGPVVVTVLQGEITLQEKGREDVIRAGESWTENPGDIHAVVNRGTVNCRVVASMLLPKGAKETTLVSP
jgi:quercetin dioxygenase-like cupin family protein